MSTTRVTYNSNQARITTATSGRFFLVLCFAYGRMDKISPESHDRFRGYGTVFAVHTAENIAIAICNGHFSFGAHWVKWNHREIYYLANLITNRSKFVLVVLQNVVAAVFTWPRRKSWLNKHCAFDWVNDTDGQVTFNYWTVRLQFIDEVTLEQYSRFLNYFLVDSLYCGNGPIEHIENNSGRRTSSFSVIQNHPIASC